MRLFAFLVTFELLKIIFCAVNVNIVPIRYDGYQVIRVIAKTDEQLKNLELFRGSFNVFTRVAGLNHPIDFLISPQQIYNFQDAINYFQLEDEVLIENVQELINHEQTAVVKRGLDYDWKSYQTLEELYEWLTALRDQHPSVVSLIRAGSTDNCRDIGGVQISYKSSNKAVFLEGGSHANEWISTSTVTFIANELVNSRDPAVRAVAERYNWYIFPSVNPDGYVYSHTVNRLWHKSRKIYGLCHGADPNRNWGYKWMEGGASLMPCKGDFAGSFPFSENVTRALAEFIDYVANTDNIEAYIAFHSYSQKIVIPFIHKHREIPKNYGELRRIAEIAIGALAKRHGTHYTIGNTADDPYVESGGSVDWVLSKYRNIELAYTFELRDKGQYGYILPQEQIIPTGEETLDALIAMFQEISH